MPTRTAKFALLLLAIAVPLCAADPSEHGKWTFLKSKYEKGARPREQTVTITKVGTDLDHKVAGTAADGSKISAWFTIPSAEGTGRVIQSATYDGVSVEWFSPSEREVTYSKGANVVNTVWSRVSSEGRSMSTHSKGVNARGESVEGASTYNRHE
jgi:hypothetical protein